MEKVADKKTEPKGTPRPPEGAASSKEATEKEKDESAGKTQAAGVNSDNARDSAPVSRQTPTNRSTTKTLCTASSTAAKTDKSQSGAIRGTRPPIAQTASLASELTAPLKKVIISRPYAGAGLVPSSSAAVRHPIISTKPNGSMQASKAIIAEATAAAAANKKQPSLIVAPIPAARPVPIRQPVKPALQSVVSAPTPSVKKKQLVAAVAKTSSSQSLPKASTSTTTVASGKKRKSAVAAPASSANSSTSSNNAKIARLQQQSATKSSSAVAATSSNPKPLADPEIVQLVENILTLLQLHGPLNRGQLEFNMPPLKSPNKSLLADVLQLLVTVGVIKTVGNAKGKGENSPRPPVYCIFGGLPRSDVLMPQTIWSDIESAQEQATASLERCGRLRRILEETTHQKKHPREALTRLLAEYPEIRDDPVFVAGLRNLQVDMSSIRQKR